MLGATARAKVLPGAGCQPYQDGVVQGVSLFTIPAYASRRHNTSVCEPPRVLHVWLKTLALQNYRLWVEDSARAGPNATNGRYGDQWRF